MGLRPLHIAYIKDIVRLLIRVNGNTELVLSQLSQNCTFLLFSTMFSLFLGSFFPWFISAGILRCGRWMDTEWAENGDKIM